MGLSPVLALLALLAAAFAPRTAAIPVVRLGVDPVKNDPHQIAAGLKGTTIDSMLDAHVDVERNERNTMPTPQALAERAVPRTASQRRHDAERSAAKHSGYSGSDLSGLKKTVFNTLPAGFGDPSRFKTMYNTLPKAPSPTPLPSPTPVSAYHPPQTAFACQRLCRLIVPMIHHGYRRSLFWCSRYGMHTEIDQVRCKTCKTDAPGVAPSPVTSLLTLCFPPPVRMGRRARPPGFSARRCASRCCRVWQPPGAHARKRTGQRCPPLPRASQVEHLRRRLWRAGMSQYHVEQARCFATGFNKASTRAKTTLSHVSKHGTRFVGNVASNFSLLLFDPLPPPLEAPFTLTKTTRTGIRKCTKKTRAHVPRITVQDGLLPPQMMPTRPFSHDFSIFSFSPREILFSEQKGFYGSSASR